jgi:hypothetical protein
VLLGQGDREVNLAVTGGEGSLVALYTLTLRPDPPSPPLPEVPGDETAENPSSEAEPQRPSLVSAAVVPDSPTGLVATFLTGGPDAAESAATGAAPGTVESLVLGLISGEGEEVRPEAPLAWQILVALGRVMDEMLFSFACQATEGWNAAAGMVLEAAQGMREMLEAVVGLFGPSPRPLTEPALQEVTGISDRADRPAAAGQLEAQIRRALDSFAALRLIKTKEPLPKPDQEAVAEPKPNGAAETGPAEPQDALVPDDRGTGDDLVRGGEDGRGRGFAPLVAAAVVASGTWLGCWMVSQAARRRRRSRPALLASSGQSQAAQPEATD